MNRAIDIDGRPVPLEIRRHPKARRIILRLHPKKHGLVVTLPKGVADKEALIMAEKHKVWIVNQLARFGEKKEIRHGSEILFRGDPHQVLFDPDAGRRVLLQDRCLILGGEEDFLHRRLTDWMKKQAKADITPTAHELAARLGKTVSKIAVRDTSSRWGSCSTQGNLSFNWRLIMAPPDVLSYVVAHEVAHLKHMDHSAAFWDTVEQLMPGAKSQRQWLKRHGKLLHQHQSA